MAAAVVDSERGVPGQASRSRSRWQADLERYVPADLLSAAEGETVTLLRDIF